MKTSTFALIFGMAYLAAGLLGLVPATLMPPPIDAPPTTFACSTAICSASSP